MKERITLRDITKTFQMKEGFCYGVKSVSLEIEEHDIYGIVRLSGDGKSTLVRTINLLENRDIGLVLASREFFFVTYFCRNVNDERFHLGLRYNSKKG